MTSGMRPVLYPVRDLAAAKGLYRELLGVEPIMDEPYYVGFRIDGQDVGLDPNGHAKGMTGPMSYWHVDDIRGAVDALLAAGAHPHHDVEDVGGGTLIAWVKDADENVIALLQKPAGAGGG